MTDCLGVTRVWNEHLPNNRLSISEGSWGGGESFIQMHFSVWELVKIVCVNVLPLNITCKRSSHRSSHPPWEPDSISVLRIILLERWWQWDNNPTRLLPKYYSLLTVLRSLTSAWWLFQKNLPTANLCTCIIASVQLMRLFASSIFLTVSTSWQRMSNRLFVIVFFAQWSEKYILSYWQGNSDPV